MANGTADLAAIRDITDKLTLLAETQNNDDLTGLVNDLKQALLVEQGLDQEGSMMEGQGVTQEGGQQVALGTAARLTIEIFR